MSRILSKYVVINVWWVATNASFTSFNLRFSLGHFFGPGSTHISEFEYRGNMGYRSLGINSNQLLGVPTTYRRSAAYMQNNLLFLISDLLWVIFLPWVHSHLRI